MSTVQGTRRADGNASTVCYTRYTDGNVSTVCNTHRMEASLSLEYQLRVQHMEANKSYGSTSMPGGIRILASTMGRTYAASVWSCPATNGKINILLGRHGSRLGVQQYGNPTEDATSWSTLNNNTLVDQYGDSTGGVTCEPAPNIKAHLPVTKRLVNKQMH